MDKTKAIQLLGGSVSTAARAIGVSYQAVKRWPQQLPPRIADRVQAALWRRHVATLMDGRRMHAQRQEHTGTAKRC